VAENNTIGVFDSGIGGLTVVKELFALVPNERIVYFGDTARVPYGTKSVETVRRYAAEDTELLLSHNISLIVVACNTVSAVALDVVRSLAGDIPVIGMIEPAARLAVESSERGRIGIIGTQATIASNAYETVLRSEARRLGKQIETFSIACPLFVPLAEEGWGEHPAAELIADEYLSTLRDAEIDTLILGCTHYPVLADIIQESVGEGVKLINSGAVAAEEVQNHIAHSPSPAKGHMFFVSDIPAKFQTVGERFLGRKLPSVRPVVYKEAWVAPKA
jgi:glutamate racemase